MITGNLDTTLLMPPRLWPATDYFIQIVRHGAPWAIDYGARYNKRQKGVHRYAIADVRGATHLTVPIVHPQQGLPWADVRISTHGRWWEIHRTALESAYGRTPFFEFYIDRLAPLMQNPENPDAPHTIGELLHRAYQFVDHVLLLPKPTDNPTGLIVAPDLEGYVLAPYWQVRHLSLGFIGALSILDLIFNLGPEAALYVRQAANE